MTATTTEGIYGRPKGMYYGVYQNQGGEQLNASHNVGNPLAAKRDSSTAVGVKRIKDNLARQNLSETNGFSSYGNFNMKVQLTPKQEK